MKYALSHNIKRNHTKKYQHNMNIITFLKSNYKYKRRCTIRCSNNRREQQQVQYAWRQQQTHPLPAGDEGMTDHRNSKRFSMCTTTKASKFSKIFILIMQPTATPSPTAAAATEATDSGLISKLIARLRGSNIANCADSVSGRQRNACKDANEDTITDSDSHDYIIDHSSSCHRHRYVGGDEMHYQRGNYDKVSTITSTPPLRCHRQKHHQMKLATEVAAAITTFSSLSSTLLSSSSPDRTKYETSRCMATLRHCIVEEDDDDDDNNDNHATHHAESSFYDSHMSTTNCCHTTVTTSSNTLNTPTNAMSCQLADQYVNPVACNRNYTMSLLMMLFMAFAIGVRTTAAGACWQTVLGSGKCNDIFSFNVSKSECCGANQEFAYTDREPTSVEYFFATAIGGGMECTPCLESCRNVRCGPNKKCVKRKGRPKCVCAPECGAARRRRLQREQQLQQQHHSVYMGGSDSGAEDISGSTSALKMTRERSRQSRDTRSLSSEITTKQVDVVPENQTPNQRKFIHIHMQQDYAHQQEAPTKRKNQQPKGNRRLLITANVEHTEKPTTRRIQLFSNVRTTYARRHYGSNNNNNHDQPEDTDLSEDYEGEEEEEEYDDDDDPGPAGKEYIKSSSSSGNDNNRNDDATRFVNQSLSRHKNKPNKNNHDHDLQTTKIQEREQYSGHNNFSHIRHPPTNGRHAENTPNRHHNHRHRHRHHHDHDSRQDHDPHQPHHNNRQQTSSHQSQNHGRHKHKKQQQHHKERPNVQKHPKNHNAYSTGSGSSTSSITTTTAGSKSTITNNVSSSSNASVLNPPPTPTSLSTSSQTQLLLQPPTTPVNSTMSAADGAVDQSRYTNHGSKIATSSSLPLSMPPSSSSPSSSSSLPTLLSAASTHSHMQSAFVTMSAAASTSSSSALDHAKGGGGAHQPHHRDHNGRLNTTPPVVAAASTTYSYNENDNTISTLNSRNTYHQHHQHSGGGGGDLLDSFFDQFDLHGFPKSPHPLTITDNIRPSNPVCGTDGRTYNSECQLRKRACRTDNPNLQVAYRGHCKTTCNGVKCLNGLTCVEDQYTMPHCIACKIECPLDDYDNVNDVVDTTRAVCGADGKTYKSMCDINRIICKIGRSIGVAYPGPCRGDHITCDDINCGPKQTCLVDLLTHQPRCTPCRYKCSRKRRPSSLRFEEEKICGVNNRTYNSWCEMRKDSCSTGFYIDVKYPGHCH